LECSLTEVFHPDYCHYNSTFVSLFGPGFGPPYKSFQLMVRGTPPRRDC
jgi:hypothetical protein